MHRGQDHLEGFVEVKSKFDAEFRRFSLDKSKYSTFGEFQSLLEKLHVFAAGSGSGSDVNNVPFMINYIDPSDNGLLPINNTDNYQRALQNAR